MIRARYRLGRRLSAIALGTVLLAVVSVTADGPPASLSDPNGSRDSVEKSVSPKSAAETRLREGSLLSDEVGEFLNTGDRLVFQPRARQSAFVVLENLALERIWSVLEASDAVRVWSVSGTVTEYRGTNYLLVTRAAMKASRKPAIPATSPESPRTVPDSNIPASPSPAGG